LEDAETFLQQLGKKQILLGRDPFHYFPGVPSAYTETCEWFLAKGYVQGTKEVDLTKAYEASEVVNMPDVDEAEFVLAKAEDEAALIDFLHRCFPGRWEYEAKKYLARAGLGREFVLLKVAGEIKGFCRINDPGTEMIPQNLYWSPLFDCELAAIGPLGVDSSERGKGYGLAIVQAGVAFLRKRGMRQIVIDWTDLVTFYEKLGFSVWKTYETFSKKV